MKEQQEPGLREIRTRNYMGSRKRMGSRERIHSECSSCTCTQRVVLEVVSAEYHDPPRVMGQKPVPLSAVAEGYPYLAIRYRAISGPWKGEEVTDLYSWKGTNRLRSMLSRFGFGGDTDEETEVEVDEDSGYLISPDLSGERVTVHGRSLQDAAENIGSIGDAAVEWFEKYVGQELP